MIVRNIYRENVLRKGIYREAYYLSKRGWHVMANHIPGFNPPPEIEGFVPDIYAIKFTHTLILYIATEDGFDRQKYMALKSYATNYSGMHFKCWQIDASGSKTEKID